MNGDAGSSVEFPYKRQSQIIQIHVRKCCPITSVHVQATLLQYIHVHVSMEFCGTIFRETCQYTISVIDRVNHLTDVDALC